MSRLAKKGITIPDKVKVSFDDDILVVTGPKGELKRDFRDDIEITVGEGIINLKPRGNSKFVKSLLGTYASHIFNMVKGVTEGYHKKLLIEGTGYRFEMAGKEVVLSVGFSHQVRLAIPEGIEVNIQKNEMEINGVDKEKVGQFAANIRSYKKPEPYKGKGIRYEGEIIERKQGKRSAA